MAEFLDSPFAPSQGMSMTPNPTPEQQQDIATRWRGFLADPESRAWLMQTGAALSQPVPLGQNGMGHVGMALAQGEEARNRVALDADSRAMAEREQTRKESDTSSRIETRTAQADTAAARANTAAVVAGAANERLQATRDRNASGDLIRAQNLYQQEVKDVRKRNADAQLLGGQQSPIPTWEEWLSRNPMLKQQLGISAPGSTPFGMPDPAAAAPQQAPAAEQRVVGQTYQTPRGPLVWMGNGQWKVP